MSKITIPALQYKQPIGIFYVGKMKVSDILELSTTDMDNIESLGEENIYQRQLDKTRVPGLKKYINYSRATFPNGIILNSRDEVTYDEKTHLLEIEKKKNEFFIMDGQHRIEALKYYKGDEKNFEICVVIFNRISIDLQTEIFATVNGEFKKVNPTVSLNLKGNDYVDTPNKIIRDLVITLNSKRNSPLYRLIKIKDKDKGKVSLAAFGNPLINFIYAKDDYYDIKDFLVLNNNDRLSLPGKFNYGNNRIFWEVYYKKEDYALLMLIKNFFSVIKDKFTNSKFVEKIDGKEKIKFVDQWNSEESVLCKTTGINALFMILKDIFPYLGKNFSYQKINGLLANIADGGTYIIDKNFGVGLAASGRLHKYFYKIIFNKDISEIIVQDELDYYKTE